MLPGCWIIRGGLFTFPNLQSLFKIQTHEGSKSLDRPTVSYWDQHFLICYLWRSNSAQGMQSWGRCSPRSQGAAGEGRGRSNPATRTDPDTDGDRMRMKISVGDVLFVKWQEVSIQPPGGTGASERFFFQKLRYRTWSEIRVQSPHRQQPGGHTLAGQEQQASHQGGVQGWQEAGEVGTHHESNGRGCK